jgi:conjugal transfer pilus assembly protein TrbC
MLFVVKNLGIALLAAFVVVDLSAVYEQSKNPPAKPDLQKVYSDALTWSKTKLEAMPNTQDSHGTAGVCVGAKAGEPLAIKPSCPKKQKLAAVDVMDDDKTPESRRHVHADIGSPPVSKILVFVSFSMPKASLKALAYEAAKHNAVLVMQGLKDDSFKTTQLAFQELVGEGQGVEVNPELFKAYQIKHVPVFVLVKGDQELGRLSGNVSLNFAANKLKGTA